MFIVLMANILETFMYVMGFVLNIALLLRLILTYRNDCGQNSGNIKYIIAAQAVFSCLTCASCLGIMFLDSFPRYFYDMLSFVTSMVMMSSLSLALFNLAAFSIVKHAQVTNKWQLRYSFVFLVFLVIIVFTVALLSPVWLITAIVGREMGFNDIHCNINSTSLKMPKERVPFFIKIDVNTYVSFYLLLQFIIPGIIIINRLLLIGLYVLRKETKEAANQSKPKVPSHAAMKTFINAMSFVVFMYISFHIYQRNSSPEALALLNNMFFRLEIVSTAALGAFPIVILDRTNSYQKFKG